LSDFIEHNFKGGYALATGLNTSELISKMLFCDDATFTASNHDELGTLIDLMGVFCEATEMEINQDKTFYSSLNCKAKNPPEHQFWKSKPSPTRKKPFSRKIGRTGSTVICKPSKTFWRYLGHFQNNEGSTHQTKVNIDTIIEEDLAYMTSRPLTPTGMNQAVSSLIRSKIEYQTRTSSLTKQELGNIQKRINKAARARFRVCKATHYNLLHGHPSGGGLGFGHIWDDTNKEKLTLLQELLYTEVPTAKAAGLNFLFRLQTASKLNEAPLTTTLGSTVVCPTGWWASSLWQWMSDNGITMATPSFYLAPFANDVPLHDILADEDGDEKHSTDPLHTYHPHWLSQCFDSTTKLLKASRKLAQSNRNVKHLTAALLPYMEQSKLCHDLGAEQVPYADQANYLYRTDGHKYYRLENPAEETGIGVECTLRHSRHHTTFQPGENAAHIPHWKDLQPVNTSCGQAGETRLINNAEWAVPVSEPATEYLQSEWNLPEDKAAILTEMIAEYLESDDAPHAQSRTRLTITSDGSHREHQQIGTFAWAIKPDGQGCDQPSQADFEYFTFADGGGEHATPYPEIGDPSPCKTSSTRLEAAAILDCLRFLNTTALKNSPPRPGCPPVPWVCDSQPAINTFNKVTSLTTRQLLNLPNKDIWHSILHELKDSYIRQHVQLVWTGSHADDHTEYHELTYFQKCNVQADQLCDQYYSLDASDTPAVGNDAARSTLGSNAPGAVYVNGLFIAGRTTAHLTEHIQMRRTLEYFRTKTHLWGDTDTIEWEALSLSSKKLHFGGRVHAMKAMHGLYATNSVKLLRGTVDHSESCCTFCGTCIESWWHITGQCLHKDVCEIRRNALRAITETVEHHGVSATGHIEALLRLTPEGAPANYYDNSTSTSIHDRTDVFPDGTRAMWHGVTHNKLAEELKTGALKLTPSIHGRILTSIRDMHKQLWVARVAILREQGNTSQPFKRGGAPPSQQHVDKCIRLLYAKGALPANGTDQSVQDCMKLPPKARRRIYAKHSKPHLSKLKQLTAPPQKDPLVQRTILVPYADRDKPHAAIVTHAKPPIETEPNTPVYAAHFISDGDEHDFTYTELHCAWKKHPITGMSTYYNGYKGHVSDAGVNDSEQHVYEITNVQNQTNAQILSTAQLHAALDPHPLHGLQLLSEAHGTETVAVVPDNPNGTGTAKLTAIVAGTPQSRTVTWDEVILHTTTKNLTFFQNETAWEPLAAGVDTNPPLLPPPAPALPPLLRGNNHSAAFTPVREIRLRTKAMLDMNATNLAGHLGVSFSTLSAWNPELELQHDSTLKRGTILQVPTPGPANPHGLPPPPPQGTAPPPRANARRSRAAVQPPRGRLPAPKGREQTPTARTSATSRKAHKNARTQPGQGEARSPTTVPTDTNDAPASEHTNARQLRANARTHRSHDPRSVARQEQATSTAEDRDTLQTPPPTGDGDG